MQKANRACKGASAISSGSSFISMRLRYGCGCCVCEAQWRVRGSRAAGGVVAGARGRGYGTRLVEDDARHSRQHLEDETTDRKDGAGSGRSCPPDARCVRFQVADLRPQEGKFGCRLQVHN